jgi:hypothetical protein
MFFVFWVFRPRLASKLAKSANMIQIMFLQKCNMGLKNAEFFANFEPVEKVAKNVCEKRYQRNSDSKIKLLTYIILCATF